MYPGNLYPAPRGCKLRLRHAAQYNLLNTVWVAFSRTKQIAR